MAANKRIQALVRNYGLQRDAVSTRVASQVVSIWRKVDPYDGRSVQDFTEQASLFMTAGQQQTVFQATSMQKSAMQLMGITGLEDFVPNVPDEVRLWSSSEEYPYAKPVTRRVGSSVSERIPVEELFNRPAREYRYLKSIGKDDKQSLDSSVNRVKMIVDTNLALAQRDAESQIIREIPRSSKSKSKMLGWRRVIHPERSKSGVCGLCIAAADRIYDVEDLSPIHDHCRCTILPVTTASDPGLSLNEDDFKTLYGPDGKTAAKYLLSLSFKQEHHGELGPILVGTKGEGIIHFSTENVAADLKSAA